MVDDHGLSERRACQAVRLARSSLRYRPVERGDGAIIEAMQAYLARNSRHGFGLLYDSFRFQSLPLGKTVLWRVYCQLKLNLPRRGKKRLPERIKQPLIAGGTPNDTWSCDFMADALWNGRRFRTFIVLGEFNREAMRIEVDTSLPAGRVARVLEGADGTRRQTHPERLYRALQSILSNGGAGLLCVRVTARGQATDRRLVAPLQP